MLSGNRNVNYTEEDKRFDERTYIITLFRQFQQNIEAHSIRSCVASPPRVVRREFDNHYTMSSRNEYRANHSIRASRLCIEETDFETPVPVESLQDFYGSILDLNPLNIPTESETEEISDCFPSIHLYVRQFKINFFNEILAYIDTCLHRGFRSKKAEARVLAKRGEKTSLVVSKGWNILDDLPHECLLLIIPRDDNTILPDKLKDWELFDIQPKFAVFNDYCISDEKTISFKNSLIQDLEENSRHYLIPLDNIVTLKREFISLSRIQSYSLRDYILEGRPARFSSNHLDTRPFEDRFNSSQLENIRNVFNLKKGFYLLQGPPGTGKTQTILGILSVLLFSRKKILVCAPSNIAINGIISRILSQGIFDEHGQKRTDVNYLRIGNLKYDLPELLRKNVDYDYIPEDVKTIHLQTILKNKLAQSGFTEENMDTKKIHKEIKKIKEQIEKARKQNNEEFAYKLLDEKNMLEADLKRAYELKKKYRYEKMKQSKEILSSTDIMFSTLSSSASKNLEMIENLQFDYLIVDEVCQSIELSTLIPLQYNIKAAVLIGDHQQLPATTFAKAATKSHYDRSLFERLKTCGVPMERLTIQYRMTQELCQFPSDIFYEGEMTTADSVSSRRTPNWIPNPPLFFLDLFRSSEKEDSVSKSYFNQHEAQLILNIIKHISSKTDNIQEKIGVITPYSRQVQVIKKVFADNRMQRYMPEINTIDGFQGKEKDFIILSLVRTYRMGFLTDKRRLNVAITRAKFGMWVIGNSCLLSSSNPNRRSTNGNSSEKPKPDYWKYFLEDYKEKGYFLDLESPEEINNFMQSF